MSDTISRQGVIESIDKFIPADPMMSDYTQGISVGLAIATMCIERFSQENHDSSQGLVKDLISRKEATTLPIMPKEHRKYQTMNLDDAYEQGWFDCQKSIEELPSAEKAQLSGEDATSVCKCPCKYRDPCDYCHYDACREYGCPAERGLKDE